MIASALLRLAAVTVLWAAATEAASSSLGYGLVAVPLVAAATYAVAPRRHLRQRSDLGRRVRGVLHVLVLAGWVLWRSVVGGFDVARRALWMPHTDIDPTWTTYDTSLRTEPGRVALALVMNFAPGSLSARLEGARLDVHMIHPDVGVEASIAALEQRVALVENAFR